jgi:hypothetical protein
MDYQSTQYTVDLLIQRIRTGRLALPDFQREFVWNPSKVVDLLDSVARRWPIGSLLLLSGPQPFAIRAIDHAPQISNNNLELYILDGQQRITSLFHAVNDVSDYCYYIDFNLLLIGDDEFIRWQRREQFEKTYPTVRSRANGRIATVKEVWELELFFAWLEQLPPGEIGSNYVSLREHQLGGLQAKVYKVMAVELDQEIELEALARIFETLNRTGVRLSAFDLMVAALYPSGFRLRDAWEEALQKYGILRDSNIDSNEVLKLISLLIRKFEGKPYSKGVRQGDLLAIEKSLIRKYWTSALELYVKALEYCKKEFGVICEEVMPTPSMALGIAIFLSEGSPFTPQQIRSWWIDRLVTQNYSQAANTRIISDTDNINSGKIELIGNASTLIAELLDQPARRNGLLLRGLSGLLISKGALDVLSGKTLKEQEKVCYCAVDEHGTLRKMNASDPLRRLILTTQATENQLGKGKSVGSLPTASITYLLTQGFDPNLYRSNEFVNALIEA